MWTQWSINQRGEKLYWREMALRTKDMFSPDITKCDSIEGYNYCGECDVWHDPMSSTCPMCQLKNEMEYQQDVYGDIYK